MKIRVFLAEIEGCSTSQSSSSNNNTNNDIQEDLVSSPDKDHLGRRYVRGRQ